MAELSITVILADGSFLLADHYRHLSGVPATVAAGLVFGLYGKGPAPEADNVTFIGRTRHTGGVSVFTLLFVLDGIQAPWRRPLEDTPTIRVPISLVLLGRAVVTDGVSSGATAAGVDPASLRFQHVLAGAVCTL